MAIPADQDFSVVGEHIMHYLLASSTAILLATIGFANAQQQRSVPQISIGQYDAWFKRPNQDWLPNYRGFKIIVTITEVNPQVKINIYADGQDYRGNRQVLTGDN